MRSGNVNADGMIAIAIVTAVNKALLLNFTLGLRSLLRGIAFQPANMHTLGLQVVSQDLPLILVQLADDSVKTAIRISDNL